MITPMLSIVVPAFNEEALISAFIERVRHELVQLVETWEIVVVDDGSMDKTRSIVESFRRAECPGPLDRGRTRREGGRRATGHA